MIHSSYNRGSPPSHHQVTTSFRMCLSLITFPGSQAIVRYLFQPAQAKSHRSRLKTRSRGLRIVVNQAFEVMPWRPRYHLVGGWALPLWKIMEFVRWDDEIPNMMGKIIQMFQTTNQSLWIKYWKIKLFYIGKWLIYGPFSTNDCVEWPESKGTGKVSGLFS
jgi:hypothetical protein